MLTKPAFRKLRGYAFDPVTSLDLETAEINELVYQVPWEDDLKSGPEGESIKVIDRDPASNCYYEPVDLNKPAILASDGLSPSETNPQFHQQMVYAVVMTTIRNFEKALGRRVSWSPVEKIDSKNKRIYEYVEKLFIYPHALRDQNAYYSPERKALLFGYFNATPANPSLFLPGGIVYTCLSHDIVAHETTHALLDGMYSSYMETTHPDMPAFHEGFADMVALLQHFSLPQIVRNQIRKVRGDLDSESLLGKLAVEFGQSTGEYSSLRDSIGKSENGMWTRNIPNTTDYDSMLECHERGSLLVSTIFDAFVAIYKNRTADLLRIATGGTGQLPHGEIHPDLVNRLADEASKTANHVLNMCVRALDYCPPVDLNFGDYLRALITADAELVADDDLHYRVAFINAFRKRGIFPEGVPNLSVETLCYNYSENEGDKKWFTNEIFEFLRQFKEKLAYETNRKNIFDLTTAFIRGDRLQNIRGLHSYLFGENRTVKDAVTFENLTGLVFSDQYKELGIRTSKTYGRGPSIEIHSVRIHNRTGPDGNLQNQIIMTLIQRCRVTAIEDETGKIDFVQYKQSHKDKYPSFTFFGGCTMIFDLNSLALTHVITKPIIDPVSLKGGVRRKLKLNNARMLMQYNCLYGTLADEMGFAPVQGNMPEPLASIHKTKNLDYEW